MNVLTTIQEFRQWRNGLSAMGIKALVPTMGALHEGHASLVRQARKLADSQDNMQGTGGNERKGEVIASIFVNPTQFGPAEDFAKYPRTLEADLQLLAASGCDVVFVPAAEEMYPKETSEAGNKKPERVAVEPGPLGEVFEGTIRPGHFRGVCTVVLKLLNFVEPTHLLLGQKDYQQQLILRRMCADLNVYGGNNPVEVVACPTVREADGLAMSSRNRYLNAEERARAVGLYEALTWAKEMYEKGERGAGVLDAGMAQRLVARGLVPDYATVTHRETLASFSSVGDGAVAAPAVLLIAARLSRTRLIDNMLLDGI